MIYCGDTKYNLYTSDVPYDAEVEYIEKDTTNLNAYIDTGLKSSYNRRVEFTIANGTTSRQWIIGNGGNTTTFIYSFRNYTNNNNIYSVLNGTSQYNLVPKTIGEKHTLGFDFPNRLIYADNLTKTISENTFTYSNSTPKKEVIGNYVQSGTISTTNYLFIGKIYNVKYWENGELIRDYIPVRVGLIGCLYDKVNNLLYNSNGSNDFIAGPDIKIMRNKRKFIFEESYPEINIINGVKYYRFTPGEQFEVKGLDSGGSDLISYFNYGATTRYDYNRLWGGVKTYTGPNSTPPKYFTLTTSATNGYIYNKTRKRWLYKGTKVPLDKFEQ